MFDLAYLKAYFGVFVFFADKINVKYSANKQEWLAAFTHISKCFELSTKTYFI